MDAPNDAQLLADWRGGNQEAFGALVTRHLGLVRAACGRQAAPGDADDCVQAVFLVLARRPAAAARAPVLAAWLLRCAWFVCTRSRRAALRRVRSERRAVVAGAAARPEALDLLDECMNRLPTRQRDALSLHYLAGHEVAEVAVALDTSRDNAYKLLQRGLVALRDLMKRRGVAVNAVALSALCAGQAQAAAVTSHAAIVSAITRSTSASASALAKSAGLAMVAGKAATVAAIAAGLTVAVALGAHALSAASPRVAAPPVVRAGPPQVQISDLAPLAATVGWGTFGRDRSVSGGPLVVEGRTYARGLGLHPPGEAVYARRPEWTGFVALVGVDIGSRQDACTPTVICIVLSDDGARQVELARSPVLRASSQESWRFAVPLPADCKKVILRTDDAGDGYSCDHVDWVECGFLTAP
jgi:RNA polymerase sigma factor (sigma-70 family)